VQPGPIELLITGAAEVVTPLGARPRGGADLARVRVVTDGAVAIDGGAIVEVGPRVAIEERYAPARTLDAAGGLVVPGFVDAHTHPVFLGTREDEFEQRLAGKTYVEIAAAGGGIASSLRGVRAASSAELLAGLLLRLDRFLALGTTTVEAKTGYGLTLEDELKCLRVIARANELHPIELVPTFLGAHDFPPEYRADRASYVALLVEEMLPAVAESGLAEYADIFTEAHVFDAAATRVVLGRARELGFALRLHVDQLTPLGGAELAAELGAVSADHLEYVSDAGIDALGAAGVIPVLCPLVPLYLCEPKEAPARRMVERGLAPALATDFNPGSCYVQSMPEVLSWAALRYGLSAAEALTAATLNAACSLGRGARLGSLEPGKRADVVVTDLPNHRHLTYELGRSPVRAVVKDGRVVFEARP
jgi:imidazolonepropionase